MLQTLYADVLFIINFSMDFLALYITAYLLKLCFKVKYAVISACVGAFYSVFTVIYRWDSVILALLVAFLMCFIAFGNAKIRSMFTEGVSFIAVNFLLGGGMTAIFHLFNSLGNEQLVMIYGDIGTVQKGMPLGVFMVSAAIIALFAVVFGRIFIRRGVARSISVKIELSGKSATFLLKEDSGNMLCEPLSGEPVIFLSERAMLRIADKKAVEEIKNLDTKIMKDYHYKGRIIIYETVNGKETGVCVRPQKITVGGKNVRAWVAISSALFSGETDGIIPSSLL